MAEQRNGFSTLSYYILIFTALFLLFVSPGRCEQPDPILFLHYWTDSLSGGVNEMTGEYNVLARTKVVAKPMEHELFKVGIIAMLETGRPPDLFSYWAGARTGALAAKGWLAPLDDLWKREKLDKSFSPTIRSACSNDGRTYLLPITQHYVGFFYNKKIFDRLGLKKPSTWDEFKAALVTIEAAKIKPIALGSREAWPAQFYFDYLLLRTAGPEFRNRLMRGEERFDSPEVKLAFRKWAELKGFYSGDPNVFDWSEAAKMVHAGDAAMTLMGTWLIGFMNGQLGAAEGIDYDFFPFPELDKNQPRASVGPIDGIAIPAGPKSAQAENVVAYFASPKIQLRMAQGSGAIAPNLKVDDANYSPLKRELKKEIERSDVWAFAYDIATPPARATVGLDLFKKFLADPARLDALLAETDLRMGQAKN